PEQVGDRAREREGHGQDPEVGAREREARAGEQDVEGQRHAAHGRQRAGHHLAGEGRVVAQQPGYLAEPLAQAGTGPQGRRLRLLHERQR
ncbi:hypothetical protein DF186_16910, partial [Enterococcus hirae]